ncbi:MAG TPA: hypothetical protein VG325_17670 [Solirubrobacteraceae bacterium]|jgi:hypothetical protein|nr:hypothetical protein [Solirubrobacteraceae bacterium]
MRQNLKAFVGGAFALIALFLVLAHAGGFAQAISSSSSGASNVFKTLQGR